MDESSRTRQYVSIPGVTWTLLHSHTQGNARLTLLAIALHANDEAEAWPSAERIERVTQLPAHAVRRSLQTLTRCGEIVETGPGRYRLPLLKQFMDGQR